MKTKIINIPEDIVNAIQRADVEMCSRRDIITFIMQKNMDIPTERFDEYQKEYTKQYFTFEQLKAELERQYIDTNMNTNEIKQKWNLDYHTRELTVYYEEV